MDDEYIDFKNMVNETPNLNRNQAHIMLHGVPFVDEEHYPIKVYQMKNEILTNSAFFKHIGYVKNNKPIPIRKHDFLGCVIETRSYIFDESIIGNNQLYLFELLVKKDEVNKASLFLSYELEKPITIIDEDLKMLGQYMIILENKNDKKILYNFESYPGDQIVVEKICEFLSHDDLLWLYI